MPNEVLADREGGSELVLTSQKLMHYLQDHQIAVYTKFPLKNMLRKENLPGRLSKWAVELG